MIGGYKPPGHNYPRSEPPVELEQMYDVVLCYRNGGSES